MSKTEILYRELMHLNERYVNALSVMRDNKITEIRLTFFWTRVRPIEANLCKEYQNV